MTYALKFLDGADAPNTRFRWPLPKGSKPGKWVTAKGPLEICGNGIHAVTLDEGSDVLNWLRADCYVIELGGAMIEGGGKLCARKGRLIRRIESWNPQNRTRFAADCAARVLSIFEEHCPDDKRPRKAIAAARAWAKCPCEKHRQASDASASDASAAAASASAASAASYASDASAYASAAAASASAASAASAYASAERRWQLKRLRRYIQTGELP